MPEDSYIPTAALVGVPLSYIDETLEPEELPEAQSFNTQRAPDYIQLVRQRAQELINSIDDADSPSEQVPTGYGTEPLSPSRLKDMLQLSEDIHLNLERMASMSRYHEDRRAAPVIVPLQTEDIGEATPTNGTMPHAKRRMNLTRRVCCFPTHPRLPMLGVFMHERQLTCPKFSTPVLTESVSLAILQRARRSGALDLTGPRLSAMCAGSSTQSATGHRLPRLTSDQRALSVISKAAARLILKI